MNRLVIRLLSRHISPLQLFGFFVANLIGMAIILLGCQFYQDATSVLGAKDRFMKGDYIIIIKQVRGGLFGGKRATASPPAKSKSYRSKTLPCVSGASSPRSSACRLA